MTRIQTLYILILIIVILILIKILLNSLIITEGFYENNIESKYKDFIEFYNPFIKQWEQAIQTYIASNVTQQPLTSPSEVSKINSQQQAMPVNTVLLNSTITGLSSKTGQTFPQIIEFRFPDKLSLDDSEIMMQISQALPSDSQPYINALNWMNSTLEESHGNLKKALNGEYTPQKEGFITQECIIQQEKIDNCNDEIQKDKKQRALIIIQSKLQSFFGGNQSDLQVSLKKNQELVNKSKDIQNQAQSGELYKQVNMKDSHYYAPYQIPEGSDKLQSIKNNNPARYNDIQQNYPQLFDIKSLIDQINGTLGN
jgi:hypothetical protein